MKSFLFFFFFVFIFINSSFAQKDKHRYSLYLVELMDKFATPYSIYRPQDFLTARAIDRRINEGIEIDWYDLPIAPQYIAQILEMGLPIQNKSKWLNALVVHTSDQNLLQAVQKLPFVKSVSPLGKFRKAKVGKMFSKRPEIDSANHQQSPYGLAENQIKMIGGLALHQLGFTGKDIHIAVVDGGFQNVYRMAVFDAMYLENRLLGTHDFVEGDEFIYESSTHGTGVMSIMAAKRPHLMIGTAPDASYYMFKTEDVQGEYKAEEFNWIAAMEYADSIGADVVNSSMGYTEFRDTSTSYQYKDLDGNTALITKGANIAVAKGLLIVNAAGNNGHKDWHYLSAPADAAGVLTIASVDETSQPSNFSSWGPTADGRIKPDVAAQGGNTAYASMIKYDVGYGDGTSYACPVMTGMVASLKQAFPNKTNDAIKHAIRQSGSQAMSPNHSLGFGIPNFFNAYLSLLDSSIFIDKVGDFRLSKKIIDKAFHIYVETTSAEKMELYLYDLFGNLIHEDAELLRANVFNKITLPQFEQYPKGVYALKIKLRGKTYWVELVY